LLSHVAFPLSRGANHQLSIKNLEFNVRSGWTNFVTLTVTFSVFLTMFMPDLSSLSPLYRHSKNNFSWLFFAASFNCKPSAQETFPGRSGF